MILAINTANEITELYLLDGKDIVKEKKWNANRQLAHDLLSEIEKLIDGKWDELSGLVVCSGPGSFTGLRIGITISNTLAYNKKIPIVGVTGKEWIKDGLKCLINDEDDRVVIPNYGAEANITKSKK